MKRILITLAACLLAGPAIATCILRQSDAVELKLGPFVDSTDGNTDETGLTISQADVQIAKCAAGGDCGAFAQKNDSGACAHDAIGLYECDFDATDTNTVGILEIAIHESGALPVFKTCEVVEEAVYDQQYAASATGAHAVSSGGITTASFASGAIDAAAIAADAIGASELAADAIGSSEIATDAIGAAELAADAIGASELAANSITSSEIADDSIDAGALAANAIGAAEIASDALTAAKFDSTAGAFAPLGIIDQGTAQAATGTTLQLRSAAAFADDEIIGASCVITGGSAGIGQSRTVTDYVSSTDTATVATWTTTPSGTITYKCFGTAAGGGSVTIASGGITASSFASGAIDATAIAADAIGASELAADAIGASEIATDAIGAAEIAASAIGSSEIADGGITSAEFGSGAITATVIATDAIGSAEIADGAIDAGALATDTITAAKIAADAIGASELATDAITSAEIAADAIGASEIATDAITSSELAATGVGEIADGVWDEAQAGHVSAGTFGAYLDSSVSGVSTGGVSVADIADAVWDEDATAHQTQGSFGQVVGDSAADTDSIWSLSNTNLNATVGSRATQTSVDAVDDYVDTEVGAIVTATSASGIRAAVGLASANLDTQIGNVPTNVRSVVVEDQGNISLGCAIAALLGVVAGDSATSGGNTTFEESTGAETRVTSVVVSAGNRTVTITCPTY